MASILIPVQGSEEVVEVHVDALPEDVNDIVDILQAEMAPLDLWLRFAVEYYKQGRTETFKMLLKPLLELAEQPAERPREFENMLYEQFGSDPHVKTQFVAILNSLASCHMATASREPQSAKEKRKSEFDEARKYLNAAQKIDLLNAGTMVGEAILLLSQGEVEKATTKLESAGDYHRGSVPVQLGKAAAKFLSGNAEEARKLYREVFAINPNPPPAVRLGLAYTSAKLGQPGVARKALERTLELHPENVEALSGLAVLDQNEGRVEEALGRLGRAYELEPSNPTVLNQLANHFFLTADYERVFSLAKRSFQIAGSAAVRAESCYHCARVYHVQGDHGSAKQWYERATKESPAFLPPYYGLGQMHLINSDKKRALECFERVLTSSPENVDALKLAGMLYAQEDRLKLATDRLTRATELAPLDVVGWLELAQVHETAANLPVALKAYEKAAGILKRAQKRVPVELWNNLGALRFRLGKLDSAEQAYSAALRLCAAEDAPPLATMQAVSVSFNLARLWEQQGRLDRAVDKYVELLKEHPNYVDCFVRLAACERAVGRLDGAIGWLKKGLEIDPINADSWCALGNIHMELCHWKEADQAFKAVIEKCKDGHRDCKTDSYALLSLANIQVHLASAKKRPPKEEHALLDKATELYRTVLGKEPNNVYAANGLGVVCAKKGRLVEARSIFTAVRDASNECDAALVNLGQLHAVQREPQAAIGLYQKAQRRTKGAPDAALLALEARAHFDAGSTADARRVLCHALHLRPSDLATKYNLCAVLHRGAKPPRSAVGPRLLPAVSKAQHDVALARSLLNALTAAAAADGVAAEAAGVTGARIGSLRTRCETLGAALAEESALATERAKTQAEAQRVADERIALLRGETEAREAAEAEAKRAAAEEESRLIREKKAQLEAKKQAWKEEEVAAREAAARQKANKKRKLTDGDGVDSDSDDPDAPAPAPEEEAAADDALFGSDSEEEPPAPTADADADADVAPAPAPAPGGRLKKARDAEAADAAAADAGLDDIFGGEKGGGEDAGSSAFNDVPRKRRRVLDDDDVEAEEAAAADA